jgi:hypothetical protein
MGRRVMGVPQQHLEELENELADCTLMGSLSADPEVRSESRRRAEDLQDRIRDLRDLMSRPVSADHSGD